MAQFLLNVLYFTLLHLNILHLSLRRLILRFYLLAFKKVTIFIVLLLFFALTYFRTKHFTVLQIIVRTYYTFCSRILKIWRVRIVLWSIRYWYIDICSKIWLNMLECSHERRRLFILLSPKLLFEQIAPSTCFLLLSLLLNFLNILFFVFCRFKNIKPINLLFLWIVDTPSLSRIFYTVCFTLDFWVFCFISIGKRLVLWILIDLTPKLSHTFFKCLRVIVSKLSMMCFLRFRQLL